MKKCILMAFLVLLAGWFSGWLFNPYQRTEERLIDAWRKIHPGMIQSEVKAILGSPAYDFNIGSKWPEWVARSLPRELSSDHHLSVYHIEGWGPQILLVAFDRDGKVSFVASTYT